LIAPAAEALGGAGTLALEAPIRAAVGLPEAVEGLTAKTAMGRIGKAAARGGTTGATLTALQGGSPGQVALSGGVGALLSGGTTAVGEAAHGIGNVVRKLRQPTSDAAASAANRGILAGLQQDQVMPEDLPARGQAALDAGNNRAVLAHLGDRGLDTQTYLATGSNSPEGAALARNIEAAQRGENEILQHGITQMSGIPETAAAEPEALQRSLTARRRALGALDYPVAHALPDVADPRIADAIRNDPDLMRTLDAAVDLINREDEAAAIRMGRTPSPIRNPLQGDAFTPGVDVNFLRRNYSPDQVNDILRQLGMQATPELPVRALDYMKQGADQIIERGIDGQPMTARNANILRDKVNSILEFLDEQRPGYAKARSGQSALFGQADAAESGANAFNKSANEIANDLTGFTAPNEADAYRATATNELRSGIKGARRNNNAQLKLDTPETEEQIGALYGPGARGRLDPSLEQARRVNAVREAALGNSKTEARQAARAQMSNEAPTDLAHALVSPKRAFYNLPDKLNDARQRRIQLEVYREMAKRLNLPVQGSELGDIVSELLRERASLPFNSGSPVVSPEVTRGAGILGGLLGRQVGQ
jgi:hypothetical protein